MRIPTITGIIERRVLVNFTVDPGIAKAIVPSPFKPKMINGRAIAGICLIRLKHVRPKGLPAFIGVGSENGAHRIAVEWEEDNQMKEGVYIPRRDTSSLFNMAAGGRIFPGRHFLAKFDVKEGGGNYHIAFKSTDGATVNIDATVKETFEDRSIFEDLNTASAFFKAGATGYSPSGSRYEGLLLKTHKWEVRPLAVSNVASSYFENNQLFPAGSVIFDNALLMENIPHEWISVSDKARC